VPTLASETAQSTIEQTGLVLLVAALLVGAVSWAGERNLVERYLTADLSEFLDYKHSPTQDPRLDYSDDGCSAPIVGSSGRSFDFTQACERHDFGYRNSKRLGFFPEAKAAIDRRFLEDMLDHCATRAADLRTRCRGWAYVFFAGVTVFGGVADLVT
jgi:hypothetical protein